MAHLYHGVRDRLFCPWACLGLQSLGLQSSLAGRPVMWMFVGALLFALIGALVGALATLSTFTVI
jgi:hypothetical protein